MKLFTKAIVDYITTLADETLASRSAGDSGELRVFTQSMPPGAVYQIFHQVNDYFGGKTARVRYEMRVAKGLYNHWREASIDQGEVKRLEQRGWIDTEDRLTHFRNLTRSTGDDLLLIVLVGIDHATDRGGLADFYTLTDEAIFRDRMSSSYQGWVAKILQEAGLADPTGAGVRDFDQFLRQLFQLRPRNLVALSEFLSDVLLQKSDSCDSASDILDLAFENLPYWGIPPLFSPANPAKRIPHLPVVAKIFDRDMFRDKRERSKAIERIELSKPDLGVAPETLAGVNYADVDDFVTTLTEFIELGTAQASERLLQTDFSVVTKILERKRTTRRKSRPQQTSLKGPSLQVFLQAIFACLQDFVAGCGRNWPPGQLQRIEIAIESFEFDGAEDDQDDEPAGAEEVFRGLVGGIDKFLQDLKIPLNADRNEGGELLEVPLICSFGYLDRDVAINSKRLKESRLRFRVHAIAETGDLSVERSFLWVLPPHHEERVRLTSARILDKELRKPSMRLPVVHLGSTLDELYFALDEGEAHRMFASGLSNADYQDALGGLPPGALGSDAESALAELSGAYRAFIQSLTERGYFATLDKPLRSLIKSYQAAVDIALRRDEEKQAYGEELLRRLYQAFLCVPSGTSATSAHVPAVLATGVTPAIAETVQAREIFLRDGFLQVARSLLEKGARPGKADFDRLLGLVELRRPLYGLVFDSSRRLTTNLRSFGLLHRLGERPGVAPTLAAQAEMRSADNDDGGSLSEHMRVSPESRVITQTLVDYREVHPYAADRLALLAANVEDLRPLIAGVDSFLKQELTGQDEALTVPYMISIWVIGRGPSATAAQEILRRWQERWSEESGLKQRPCQLTLAYRPARSRKEVLSLLNAVDKQHDIGFLFDFLNDQTGGDSIVPASPFEHDWRPGNIGKFPVCEHPRPARPTDPHLRQGLVSNRRFQLAARHAEVTARLKNPDHPGKNHLIFNQVEYGEAERQMTRCIHKRARWVACVDRFVDKALILDANSETAAHRKLVGFTSGVGAYGEFNLTLSTESSTVGELLQGTARQLGQIYREWTAEDCQVAAQHLVEEAQAITGLSLVRALGNEGVMRDVIGYAIANHLYLGPSRATLCAAIPLDSFPHWFAGAEHGYVPDLLLLEARLNGERFAIDATIVECKVGKRSPAHVEEAVTQAASGLLHLGSLFLPNSVTERASDFDRRYWWAQLHRALVVRNVRTISPTQEHDVDQGLEQLAEGSFDIHWRAVGATFWTDDDEEPKLRHARSVGLLPGASDTPLEVYHASVGQSTTLAALKNSQQDLLAQIRPTRAASITLPGAAEGSAHDAPSAPSVVSTKRDAVQQKEPAGILQTSPVELELQDAAEINSIRQESNTQPELQDAAEISSIGNESAAPPAPHLSQQVKASGVLERILLGTEINSHGDLGVPVYWEFGHPQLPNRHLLVFGGSGAGKTYAIQALLLEMAKAGQASLVIDYTDGFLPKQLEAELRETAVPNSFVLRAGQKLPLDPFRPQSDEIEGIGPILDTPFDVAKRVASIFTVVYSSLGEQQRATLVDMIEQGVSFGGYSLQALYDQLRDEGEDLLANKIMPLARTDPFTSAVEEAWGPLFDGEGSRVNILQLAHIPAEVQRLIIEFVLWDLWDFLRRTGSKQNPRPVVLDEVQNLDHSSGSPLEKYLREGRKFGASMILATQTLSNFRSDERDRLFQAAHMLFFAPAATELRSFASILKDLEPGSSIDDWSRLLSSLKKGECLSVGLEQRSDGSLRSQIRRVAISPLSERVGAGS
ncbi:AAA-like domain protein [Halomonas sp. THAF5a]|uniref:ATP-binding protein n=1 Tax=Halomonas sp. THAF5a TaxID=2587844 RepID=UPI001268B791|nr:ATP-binding protein [Halomonas sp. THAF5a]QFU01025.1 AAA-like domain protein [Halomonas sp. THAF5a]